MFTYELATHLPALFGMGTFIRVANKPQLSTVNLVSASIQGDCKYVLDGGELLQQIPWPRGLTYDNTHDLYFKYACQKYGTDSIVVFDGFVFDGYTEMPSTKDTVHIRRIKEKNRLYGHVFK